MRKATRSIGEFLIVSLFLMSACSALAAEHYQLTLEGRTYVPEKVRLAHEYDSHLVIQFYEIPTQEEREALAEAGITLLDYIPNYAWTAFVRGGAVQSLAPGAVRTVFELRPSDKVLRSASGRSVVRAFVYDDVADPESVLSRYGSILDRDRTSYTIELSRDVLDLASEDIVRCVMGPRPEKIENNDDIRADINANEVQAAPYDLHGNGLFAGIWDGGTAATNHDDFSSRLTIADGAGTGSHATECTGIMAGDGSRSQAEGGTPYQWRGIATEVNVASYDWPYDLSDMDIENADAISSYDIVVSSNSWGWGLCPDYCDYYGVYDDWSWNYDRLVRGNAGKKLTIVFSAGNDGDCSQCSGYLPDFPYGTIPGPGSTAKNTIVVGSNDADDDGLSYYSSQGPTLDGRLKPDIVAPGCKSHAGITTTYIHNDYISSYCGTSFSCPAVSGCVVLTQEDYLDKFGSEAWPSTVKALLIQGAEDKGNIGPDYRFGHGRVNIQNTIDIIRADGGTGDLIREDSLSPSETWEYDVLVTPGADLKVTLAWDDYEGDYATGGTMLVNDLDLEVESPTGIVHYPWLLDPNHPSNNATTGIDHLNNVEQVVVESPMSGTWTVRVTSTIMPEPDQDFSVVTNFAGGAPDLPPDPPTGLNATPGSGEGEIDTSWNANSEPDLDHYRLERDDSADFLSAVSFTTTGTSYDDSGLTPGEMYYYRLFAVDAGNNESGPSSVVFATATDLPPSAPTDLSATAGTGEGEIHIDWTPPPQSDVDGYRLERADNPGFSGATSFPTGLPDYTDSGLTPGQTYYYRAFAVDTGGNESGASNTDSAVARDLAPAAPTGLVAETGTGEGEIDISWSANSEPDIDRYILERSTAPDFDPGSEPFEGAVTYFTDTDLIPGELYYYRVYAIDVNENVSDPSVIDSAVALDLAPAMPTGLVAVPGAGEGEVDVSWDANAEPDLDHYDLEWDTDPGFVAPEGTSVASASYTSGGLIPGGTYWFHVRAVDSGGNPSGWGAPQSSQATDLAPAAPSGLVAASGPGEGEIDVSWDANPESDLDHYRLERCVDDGFGPGTDPFDLPEPVFHDSGLVPGDTYYYRAIAVDAGGNESGPSEVDFAVATDLAPAAPTGLTAVTGSNEGEIEISWNPSSEPDIDRYRLERSLAPDFEPGSEPFEEPAVSYTDTDLIPGELYYYRVYAIDLNDNVSAPSAPDSAVALDLAPAAPAGVVAAEGPGEGDVDLSWDANIEPDIDHYRVERDTSDVFGVATFSADETGTTHSDAGLDPDTYFYRVFAVDANRLESVPSDTVSFTVEQTGVADEMVAAVSFVRPNPFSAETTIHYNVPAEGAGVTIRLYDIRGRLVRTLVEDSEPGGAHEVMWDGRDRTGRTVASGVYFASVSIGEWSETRKIAYVR